MQCPEDATQTCLQQDQWPHIESFTSSEAIQGDFRTKCQCHLHLELFCLPFFFNGCASQYFSSDETLCLLTETKRHLRNRNLGDRSLSLKRWSVLPVFKLFLYQINSNRSHLITGSFERNCIICFLRLGFR